MDPIRFDDVESIRKQVSEEFGPWGPEMTVTQEMIEQFADLTGDHQWIHVDVERARKQSPFGGPVAHGFLTLSLLPSLTPKPTFALTGFGNVVNYGSDKLRFTGPVLAGSKIHMRGRLKAVEKKPKGTQIVFENHIHVVGSERPAVVYETITLFVPPVG